MKHTIVFDVNETLLDVTQLAPAFEDFFEDPRALREWFAQLLLYSQTLTISGQFFDFSVLGRAAAQMLATSKGISRSDRELELLLAGFSSLPPHPDVVPALERLRERGFRLVALSNSSAVGLEAQLRNAGIAPYFERQFSVDRVRKFKPAPEVYQHVANELRITCNGMRMVAAHAWDILGASCAGCATAFVARPGAVLFPLRPSADIIGPDLIAIAEEVIRFEARN